MTGAGARRERVTFQQRSLDANGDRLGPWDAANGFTRWARARALVGKEAVIQARLQGVQPVEFVVLADSDTIEITTAWRALWRDQPFNLRAVAPDERRRELTIMAEADQSNG